MVLRRARVILRPPAGLSLRFAKGVLRADGTASPEWIVESARIAPAIGGVLRYDPGPAVDLAIDDLARQLAASPVLFARGLATLAAGSDGVLQGHVRRVRAIDALAASGGRRVRLEIVGHTDTDGPPESNDPLSLRRAERVRAAFDGERLIATDLITRSVGSREPLGAGFLEGDKLRNRRVSLRVLPSADVSGK
jgi:outer membrane protein OmpA-like peptidoglycan-associated protein